VSERQLDERHALLERCRLLLRESERAIPVMKRLHRRPWRWVELGRMLEQAETRQREVTKMLRHAKELRRR
jgi:hypothetical protein